MAGADIKNLSSYIDHTILKADATESDVIKLCREAAEHNFCSVCVNSSRVLTAAEQLKGSSVKVCSVVGFPLGAMNSEAKGFEASIAVSEGAAEIDMVINIGFLKEGKLDEFEEDIRSVRKSCGEGIILKVIIETALLTDEEKKTACRIAEKAGADFVKTSTGFSTAGATAEDVALMRASVSEKVKVKAAGGVRSYEDAVKMIEAGAERLGTSSGIAIINGQKGQSAY